MVTAPRDSTSYPLCVQAAIAALNDNDMPHQSENLGHTFDQMVWAMGLAGEAGETADYLKKVLGHGHPLDLPRIEKELGDVLWYLAVLANSFGLSLNQVAKTNVEKLRTRYPEGFSSHASLNRSDT